MRARTPEESAAVAMAEGIGHRVGTCVPNVLFVASTLSALSLSYFPVFEIRHANYY